MKRSAAVYIRKGDAIYLIPKGITTQGFVFETEPFEYLSHSADLTEVWGGVLRALENANRTVPHPSSWGEETAWYRKAGVKTWRQFGSKAKSLHIYELDTDYQIKVLHWEKGGFSASNDDVFTIRKDAPLNAIITLLQECLERALSAGTQNQPGMGG